ncbi:MAG: sugar MFS transporter, partial [Bacteroidales bacterium]|nr:sugar MFS transporter [Bacteroidales bacterium]
MPAEQNLQKTTSYTVAFVVVTGLFFMWGFMTVLNDILIPYLKGVFDLNHTQAMFVQFAFFMAYFVGSVIYFFISITGGDPISRIGYKNGILAGLLISATGSALFYPAAEFKMYGFFLAALFVMGLGFTLLQIAANPYVAILGSEKSASSRLNLSQGFNSLGTTIGPLIGGFLIFKYFAGPNIDGADAVKIPYMIFTGMFLLLAVLIKVSHLPRVTAGDVIERTAGALRHPNLVFGALAIFFYVGGEVSIGSILISYLGLESIAGLGEVDASKYVAFYWGGLMIGRFLGAISLSGMKDKGLKYLLMLAVPASAFLVIWYFNGIDHALIYGIFLVANLIAFMAGRSLPHRTLLIFALIAIALLIVALLNKGQVAMWAVIGIGLFNSIMWSNIFTLSIEGLGKFKSQGSSLLVMMILGGAIVPVFQGMAADAYGVHASFFVPVICYVYLAFYGWKGY